MANNNRPKTVNSDDAQAQEQLAEQAHSELPEAGYERRETLKRREATLEEKIAQMSERMLRGTIDPSSLEIANEIANKTQYLHVSGAQTGYVYGWLSTNRSGLHVQKAKNYGWEVVQGDDPEALELKGEMGGGTTRQLGDVILMRMKEERYIVLKAQEQARTARIQQSSASNLVELGQKYRSKGFTVKPYGMNSFEGPEIKSGVLSRKAAFQQLDGHLRAGTVPGMEIG